MTEELKKFQLKRWELWEATYEVLAADPESAIGFLNKDIQDDSRLTLLAGPTYIGTADRYGKLKIEDFDDDRLVENEIGGGDEDDKIDGGIQELDAL